MTDNTVVELQSRAQIVEFQKLLAKLEMEIHSRGELSLTEVIDLLHRFYDSFNNRTLYPNDAAQRNYFADELFTRMATLLSLWASCEDKLLSVEDLSDLCRYKEVITSIFYNSGYHGFSHLKTYLTEQNESGAFIIPHQKLLLYFVFVHIDDVDENFLKIAMDLPETYFTILMLGWLNSTVVLTEQGERNRALLYEKSTLLSRVNPNQAFITSVINAWMYCSYSSSTNKRNIKINLNKMIGNFLRTNGFLPNKSFSKQKRNKPRILVVHERAGKNHAMLRCYLPVFRSLVECFEVFSMAEQEITDESCKPIFPEHVLVKDPLDFKNILNHIENIAPDIIYYPSLGMSHWTIALANLRLAPMQIMSCGHPESSFSESMDFLYLGPEMPGAELCCSENVLQTKDFRFLSVAHSDFSSDLRLVEKHADGNIHVAINCNAMKLSSEFINVLKSLKEEFKSQLKLHFFPAGDGLFNDGFKSKLYKIFPEAIVYSSLPYSDFMRLISRCHISLSPFPFGNTNSTVDALLLGLPVVALKRHEICSYTDYLVMKSFGLDEEFVCESSQDYLEKCRVLISDKAYYQASVEKVKSVDILSILGGERNQKHEFGEFVLKIFGKLNMYKSKKHRLLTWKDGEIKL